MAALTSPQSRSPLAAPGPLAWGFALAAMLGVGEAWALVALCQAQVDRAEARREVEQVQDAVFGYCLDQFNAFTISRCRKRFAARP